jgi:aspartate kinase
VFEVFEKNKTSIDMISTSEVAVSLTIDDDRFLPEIQEELEKLGTIEIEKNQTIICIVGNGIIDKGVLRDVFDSLADIKIRMVAYGGSHNNISVLVDTAQKEKSLNLLNEGLFNLH